MTCTETVYIESAASLQDRLQRIINIIEALELRQVEVIGNSDQQSYSLDDGQVKISTIYRSPEAIARALEAYERIKQRLFNQLNGRGMVLRPWQGMTC